MSNFAKLNLLLRRDIVGETLCTYERRYVGRYVGRYVRRNVGRYVGGYAS